MNCPSHTCDHGPCPRSWHSPAICTMFTSRSVIRSSGWDLRRCSTMHLARCPTPARSLDTRHGLRLGRDGRRTETVLEPVMRGPRPYENDEYSSREQCPNERLRTYR
ncbi:unnamed protein product [Mycena citricolor]|uniref:Uncharacterized protein n=1 Tax=Mycena citricolor TaxID=2018698 RepID=A0AAD2HS61_9AGAR|nr:unnamed protein product [Mycena citricolor]